jgi:hypothetical protein
MAQSTDTQDHPVQAKPHNANRLGVALLVTGLALYLIVLGVGLTEAGVRTEVATKAVSTLAVSTLLFPLAALVLFAMEFVEGVLIGTPVAWYAYTLSVLKNYWMAVVGSALLIIALLAIVAAGTV